LIGLHAELGYNSGFIAQDILSAIKLDDSGADHALAEIFIWRTDEDLIYTIIFRSLAGGGGESVICLVVNHRPDPHSHCFERLFENRKLREHSGGTPSLVLYPGYRSLRKDSTT